MPKALVGLTSGGQVGKILLIRKTFMPQVDRTFRG